MLRIDKLTKYYGKFLALDGLSLEIENGKLHGFVGPNGAGKTTTMRILATLLSVSSGDAWINGVSVRKEGKKIRRIVGYMPDFFGVYDGLKVYEYLDFYGSCYGIAYKERLKVTDQMLELVALTDKKNAYVDTLSRGMKQRLCLARSLIHNPVLVILDEPASGMDPRARAEMKGILRTLKDINKTVLISSHILPELSEICDSLSIIERGKLLFSGDMNALARYMQKESPLVIKTTKKSDEMTRILKETHGVTGIEVDEEGAFRVEFSGDRALLLAKLVEEKVPVYDFHRAPVDLETAFMEVTQHDDQPSV